MKVTTYFGNSWLGLFLKTNEEITLVPVDTPPKVMGAIEAYLKTSIIKTNLGDSNLLGLYCAINSNGIILPNITNEKEMEFLRQNLKQTSLNIYHSPAIHNAHGNNILVNDNGGLINTNIGSHEQKKMEDALGVELLPAKIANYLTVGSACLANNKGWLSHFNTREEEAKLLEQMLKVKGGIGSLNMGAGFVGLAAIANNKGYLAGEASSGFELGKLEEVMGFL